MSNTGSSAQENSLSRFTDAYEMFSRAREKAGFDFLQRINEAQEVFRSETVGQEDADTVSAAFKKYSETVRHAWCQSQDEFVAAHNRFLEEFGSIWAETDNQDLGPTGLIAIANGLVGVAAATASDIGNLGVFYATGVSPPDDAHHSTSWNNLPLARSVGH